ncbi:hypothetical protein BOH74_23100, partial [Pseudomonas versuta]
DSLSPFGEGGLNGYSYCAGDPVNRIDPSGHSWLDWLLPAVGIAFGVMGAVASFGALAAPAAALTASYITAVTTATLSVVSLAADVASIALLATGNESAGRILGFVGMATGLASAAPSIAGAAAKGVSKAGKFVGAWQHKLQNAGGVPGRGGMGVRGARPRLNVELDYMLEQGGIRERMLSHLSRGDLQNIGQTNSANRAAIYRPGSSTAAVPLQLPSPEPVNVFSGPYLYPAGSGQIVHNPGYIMEVRQIISGSHPQYYPWQLGEAGIQNPRQLRIVSSAQLDGHVDAMARHGRADRLNIMESLAEADNQWFRQNPLPAASPAAPANARARIARRVERCRMT